MILVINLGHEKRYVKKKKQKLRNESILLFKGLPLLRILIFFLFKNIPTFICLSKDKIKKQSGKNTTLTSTKILPKK